MRIDIATLFPEMCEAVMNESILGRAVRAGFLEARCHQIRDYTADHLNRIDDRPYGGGKGMLIQADPLYRTCKAVEELIGKRPYIVYLSPKGAVFQQKKAVELSKRENLLLVCGHYEGVDQRFIDEMVDEEISVGDFVLTGGELAALIVADAVARLCDGVLADTVCFTDESHFSGLLDHPHYTRPPVWHGREVPPVLVSGNHAVIERWKRDRALELTRIRRPDMLETADLTKEDRKFLDALAAAESAREADQDEA